MSRLKARLLSVSVLAMENQQPLCSAAANTSAGRSLLQRARNGTSLVLASIGGDPQVGDQSCLLPLVRRNLHPLREKAHHLQDGARSYRDLVRGASHAPVGNGEGVERRIEAEHLLNLSTSSATPGPAAR